VTSEKEISPARTFKPTKTAKENTVGEEALLGELPRKGVHTWRTLDEKGSKGSGTSLVRGEKNTKQDAMGVNQPKRPRREETNLLKCDEDHL